MNKSFFELYNLILNEKPRKSDAIIWLQGDRYDRAPVVFKLFTKKASSKIILVGNNLLIGRGARVGENNISLERMAAWLIKRGINKRVIKIMDYALNTPRQAYQVIKYAKKKKWKSILLVGSSFYQPRAFLTFLREKNIQNWKGRIINQPAIVDEGKIPGGRDKTASELLAEEYEKILKYKKNLVKISDGIMYLKKNTINLVLRKAKKSDANLMFKWRNDIETRMNSFNQNKLNLGEHIAWFYGSLSNKNRAIYIIKNANRIVGQVRFDIDGRMSEIDITIDRKFRGQGFGGKAIELGTNYFLKSYLLINKIISKIKAQNIGSISAHLRAGYKQIGCRGGIVTLEYARDYH